MPTAQWSNFTRAIVVTICIILATIFFYIVHTMINPLIIAGLLAYVLHPFVRLARTSFRLSHSWAVFGVYYICLAIVLIIPSTLTPVVINQTSGLSAYLKDVEGHIKTVLEQPVVIFDQEIHLGEQLSKLMEMSNDSVQLPTEQAILMIESTSTSFAWLLVILVSTYYFLLDGEHLRDWFISLATESEQPYLRRLVKEINLVWRAYMWGTLLLMVIVGVTFMMVWSLMGLPGALVLGFLTGLLSVIPEVGPTFAAMLAVLVAFSQGSYYLPLSNFWFAVAILVVYFVLIQIKGIWLRPRIMGYLLKLNEGLIFVAIISSVVFWGILGALVIIPLMASMALIGRYVRCRLLHLNPWPDEKPILVEVSQQGQPFTTKLLDPK
jgi:predicted PurR-regulated permease PerM